MKSLGIIRKIDDLGRIVIPKEVRDTQDWKSGQPMEMFMSQDGLVLKAYHGNEEKEKALNILDKAMDFADRNRLESLRKELLEVVEYVEGK